MTAQLAALIILGLVLITALVYAAVEHAARNISRHVEAAFDTYTDEVMNLGRIDSRTVFQQTLDAMPAAAGVVELGGEGR